MSSLTELGVSFALNLVVNLIIIRFIYYPRQRDKDYVFTFAAFSTIIFFVMGLMNSTELGLGVGFGLFAIFSILRYRTDTVPIREMTYLFVLIALGVVNSLLFQWQAYAQFLFVNCAVIAVLYVLERGWGFRYETRKQITYERIDLIHPDNEMLLLADLQKRTGLPIHRVEIGRLNFLRDSAEIMVYYNPHAVTTRQVNYAINIHSASDDDR